MSRQSSDTAERSQQTREPRVQKGRRAIVVDDDPDLLEAMVELMTAWGFTVLAFDSFEKARAKLAQGGGADTLVVDVRLGMFNGLQLMHLAKQRDPAMVVIAMSGFDDPLLRAEAEAAGATYFVKPIEPSKLQKQLLNA